MNCCDNDCEQGRECPVSKDRQPMCFDDVCRAVYLVLVFLGVIASLGLYGMWQMGFFRWMINQG